MLAAKNFSIAAFIVIIIGFTVAAPVSSAKAQAVRRFVYDPRPPISDANGIGVTINWAAAIGSGLLDRTFNGTRLRRIAPHDSGYPENQ
jgi:hypothetical protein